MQIFGDGAGGVLALGERDCSLQRRNQKVIEETPAPGLSDDDARGDCVDAAVRLGERGRATGRPARSSSSSTPTPATFYFLEVNTRLQVEHGVTEEVTGIDLVEWMVRLAAGERAAAASARHRPRGAAIQVRVYAEDPRRDFRPSAGVLTDVVFPRRRARRDGWVEPAPR